MYLGSRVNRIVTFIGSSSVSSGRDRDMVMFVRQDLPDDVIDTVQFLSIQ